MKKVFKKFLIAVLIGFALLFVIWLFDDSDYEDTSYANDSDYSAETGGSSADSANSSAGTTTKELSDYFDTSAVREHGVKLKGDGTDTVTVLMYVNGSDLESDDGEATEDISEVIKAGTSENVNYIIQTMGTKKWSSELSIASDHSQRYKVVDGGLELIDDSLGQLDCTDPDTLSDFIKWGAENYPADRYILQFWDHGGGPVYGFGYDEWQDEDATLTIDEMKTALSDGGIYFDVIGMDCCIMSSLEVCMALYDYCDYAILSEEFESGLGWSYTGWVDALNKNSSIDTVSLAKIAIDDNVNANENDTYGDSACMALIDESVMKVLYTAWTQFAYANEDTLLGENYSQQVKRSKRALKQLGSGCIEEDQKSGSKSLIMGYVAQGLFSNFDDDAQLSDYYITDIMAVAQNISSTESDALSAAVSNSILYSRATSDDSYMTGLSVTLPYGDNDFYSVLKEVFTNCGFDETYVSWLGNFVTAEGSGEFYDYDEDWGDEWNGWDEYEDDYDWGAWDYSEDAEYWDDEENWGWDDENYTDSGYYIEDSGYDDGPFDDGYFDDGPPEGGPPGDGYFDDGPPGGGPFDDGYFDDAPPDGDFYGDEPYGPGPRVKKAS